jgi:hypothetical protein
MWREEKEWKKKSGGEVEKGEVEGGAGSIWHVRVVELVVFGGFKGGRGSGGYNVWVWYGMV